MNIFLEALARQMPEKLVQIRVESAEEINPGIIHAEGLVGRTMRGLFAQEYTNPRHIFDWRLMTTEQLNDFTGRLISPAFTEFFLGIALAHLPLDDGFSHNQNLSAIWTRVPE